MLSIKRYLLIVLMPLVLAPSISISAVLDIPQKYQEEDQWCWAACSEAVLDYYGTIRTQTDIAQYGTGGANIWNWIYGSTLNPTRRGIDLILLHFGEISSMGRPTVLSQATVQGEIDGGRPIVIRWGWDSGGGHHLVVRGIEPDSIYLMDPWNGPTINSYSWVCDGANHTWTHSLQLTTNPAPLSSPQPPANLRVEGDTTLKWDPCPGAVSGYRIYYGTIQGNYVSRLAVGKVTDYSIGDLNLPAGVRHYFVVTAYNDAGESAFSNEVSWAWLATPPPTSPTDLRVH